MIKKLDHIGIAVQDLDQALKVYAAALGIQPSHQEVVEEQGVRVTFLPVGESNLELVESIDPESTTAKFLANRGEGIHHICLEVDDVQATVDSLCAAGVNMIDTQARRGAHGTKVAFIHPKGASGVLVELLEHSTE